MGLGQRFTHFTASSIDLTFHNQEPGTRSLVSANGPSLTVRLFPENLTRLPYLLGFSPSPASMMPALTSSSLKVPISLSIFSSPGLISASDSFVALTITITRIGLPFRFAVPRLTHSSNGMPRDRRSHAEARPNRDRRRNADVPAGRRLGSHTLACAPATAGSPKPGRACWVRPLSSAAASGRHRSLFPYVPPRLPASSALAYSSRALQGRLFWGGRRPD